MAVDRQFLRRANIFPAVKNMIEVFLDRFVAKTYLQTQGAPAAKTVTTTLTAAELLGRLLTANQGGGALASYTLPLATALETALLALPVDPAVDDSFDFTIINISANAAEDVTILTNTGWTLVGSMAVESNEGTAQKSPFGTFRVRRTAINAYTLYRVA